MATRMQQRRGTAAQWTAADPILAAGEIGFESDTGQFKIGDGVNHWDDISYFKNLEDLGGSLDDYIPVDTKAVANGVASLDAQGRVPLSQLGNLVDGAPGALNTLNELAAAISNDATFASTVVGALAQKASLDQLSNHTSVSTNIHGIADTALLATKVYADGKASDAQTAAITAAGTAADTKVSTHSSDTTNVHGISDTSLLATTADVAAVTKTTLGLGNVDNTADTSKPVSTAQATAIATAKSEAIADATAQVSALLTGAPEALNTLDELAAALGDDANFASSVTTSLGLKVDSLTPISRKTASYTLSSLTERDDLVEMGSASAMTLTIPTDATLDFPIGTSIDILQTSTG